MRILKTVNERIFSTCSEVKENDITRLFSFCAVLSSPDHCVTFQNSGCSDTLCKIVEHCPEASLSREERNQFARAGSDLGHKRLSLRFGESTPKVQPHRIHSGKLIKHTIYSIKHAKNYKSAASERQHRRDDKPLVYHRKLHDARSAPISSLPRKSTYHPEECEEVYPRPKADYAGTQSAGMPPALAEGGIDIARPRRSFGLTLAGICDCSAF